MKIAGRDIGPSYRPYMVAEISANHGGKSGRALSIMESAKMAGADAIKIQAYTADGISTKIRDERTFIKDGPWAGKYLYDLYKSAETPPELVREMFEYGKALGISVFSSVFDVKTIELLEKLDNPAYKIASFELTDLELIKQVAMTGKPVILSTGMGSDKEIGAAIDVFHRFSLHPSDLVVLHCVSAYPTPASEANLPKMGALSSLRGGLKVGLSDHTLGVGVPVAAVAYGACLIEKHFIQHRSDGGPDAAFSAEPEEFAAMVEACNEAWEATKPSLCPSQTPNSSYRKSLYASVSLQRGQKLSKEQVVSLRPAIGLPASALWDVVGALVTEDVPAGTPLMAHHFET